MKLKKYIILLLLFISFIILFMYLYYKTPNILSLDMKKKDDKIGQKIYFNIIDTDGDGFSDEYELKIGTDPNNVDTDGDGLSDYEEFYISNPLIKDSDKDFDEDGISNYEEIKIYKTSPIFKDTDFDGLSDYEEIFKYKTNPHEFDTDFDTITDFDEIKCGMNPLIFDSKEKEISKKIEGMEADKIILNIEIDTNVENYNKISLMPLSEMFDSQIVNFVGYLGGYEIKADYFTSIKMQFKFEIPNGKILGKNYIPTLYYYNENTKKLEKIKNIILDEKNNTLIYKLNKCSNNILKYVICDDYEIKSSK